jgi:hypothetical protein
MRSNLQITWKIIISPALLLFALSAIWIQPARAQSQDERKQDIQELKDKLQQLEQMMNEVKGEINTLESTSQTPAVAPATGQGPAKAEKAPAQAGQVVAIPSEEVISQPQAGTVPMEGEITERKNSVDIYGFAMLDSGYDFGQVDPNWFDVVRPTKLPSFHNEFAPSGNVYAGVRQTRFGVKSSTSTQIGRASCRERV